MAVLNLLVEQLRRIQALSRILRSPVGSTLMETLARVSWLFVRGEETIRVTYAAEDLSVAANGPGNDRRAFRFADGATAAEFLKLYEHFLASGGWVLQAFVERRADRAPDVLPVGGDRRRRSPVKS